MRRVCYLRKLSRKNWKKLITLITELKEHLPEVDFTEENIEKTIKIKRKLQEDGPLFMKHLKKYSGPFPITMGRVSKEKHVTKPLKTLINNYWSDKSVQPLFIDYFKQHGFDYREVPNKSNTGYQKKIFKMK